MITITLPSRRVRKRLASPKAPEARARLVERAGPCCASVGGAWLPVSTATIYLTPGAEEVPSKRDFVLLYGTTVFESRNFRPVSTSAIPVSVFDAWYR